MGIVNKIILTLFVFISIGFLTNATAQFTFELRSTNSQTGSPGETLIIIGDFENNSGEDIDIVIVREEENVPADWSTAMCTDFCYTPEISQVFMTLYDGDTQSYSMYFYTAPGNENSGSAKISFTNLADTSNRVEQEYFGHSSFAVDINELESLGKEISIFPTLVKDELNVLLPAVLLDQITEVSFSLFDTGGKLILSSDLQNPENLIQAGQVPAGNYFYSIMSEDGILRSGQLIFE